MPLNDIKIAIPVLNEEEALAALLPVLSVKLKNQIIFINNGSKDETETLLKINHCFYLNEDQRGYGATCYKAHVFALENDISYLLYCDIEDLANLESILQKFSKIDYEAFDFIFTKRVHYRGALHAYLGTRLIIQLSKLLINRNLPNDLGPIRMVNVKSLESLKMEDRYFGWTLEMQLRSFHQKKIYQEVEIEHSSRIYGQSKISGNIKGTIKAAYYLLTVLCKNVYFSKLS